MQSGGWKRLRKAVELGPELGAAVRAGSSTWRASVGRSSHRLRMMVGEKELVKEKASKMWLLMEGLFLITTLI